MGLVELLLLAVGLSMDAFAVSVCKGLAMGDVRPRHMLICGAWFGGFQALMPMIGYLLGSTFESFINAVSGWVAFGLLVLIGGNMLREALSKEEEKETNKMDVKTMFLLALAASIDALAVGITFACVPVQLFAGTQLLNTVCTVLIIGATTFVISCVKIGGIFGTEIQDRRGDHRGHYPYPHRRENTPGTAGSSLISPGYTKGAVKTQPLFRIYGILSIP